MRRTLHAVLGLVLAGLAAMTVPAVAGAQERLVTYVARVCPSYTDVSANLARNNIQESLRDLGPDTDYVSSEPIAPAKEEPGQPNCRPLTGWHFHLGEGIGGQITGTWGALSYVSNPYDTSVVTRASTPLLNDNGDDTGYSLPGAVTVALTEAQYERSTQSSALWVQGGDVDDPVLDRIYPNRYGFAALRCAIDNYNGDNVEFINYPQGARHVYCYAYYIEPPPTSGTIVVRKVVDDPAVRTPQPFTFEGNISYTSDHTFELDAAAGSPAQETFYRGATGAGDPPWTFAEDVPPGWSLTNLTCLSATGASTTTTDPQTAATSVHLGAGDVVTCTYTDRTVPPAASLVIGKRTLNDTGTFAFRIAGPGGTAHQSITTRSPGVVARGATLTGTAGTYEISETLPDRTAAGHWTRTGAACGARLFGPATPVRVTVAAGDGAACVFTNTFIPAGSLTLHKVTIGATGSARFQIGARARPAVYVQQARTDRELIPATATGDDTSQLRLGTYDITETDAALRAGGYWRLAAVLCDGTPVGGAQGTVQIRLTSSDPSKDCTFYDQFIRGPEPPDPNPPQPDPDHPAPPPNTPGTAPPVAAIEAASGPDADLVIAKRVTPRIARPGQPAHYTVTVVNHGPEIAYNVVVAELNAPNTRLVRLRSTQGPCVGVRPARCSIGTVRPGQTVTITGTVPAGRPGTKTNRVGLVSSTTDPNLNNNAASATELIRTPSAGRAPSVTG